MKLTPYMLRKASTVNASNPGARIVFDRRGIHHRTVPAKDFVTAITHHAMEKKLSVAESLCTIKRLRDLGAVHTYSNVTGQGAAFQTFRGTGDKQGCHTMPCQLVLDHQYPHQILPGNGQSFNTTYQSRMLLLFARCTWSPKILNPIDQALDWTPEAGFVKMYLDSVKGVLAGQEPRDAYHDLSWRRQRVLNDLHEQIQDQPLSMQDAMLLLGARTLEPGTEATSDPKEVERLLADEHFMQSLEDQREIVVDTYAFQEQTAPVSLDTGELQRQVDSETWIGKV